ncbi:MAG TPA: hypothetical protein VD968_03725, partial [Pyrinomonadaceae bacterium]|nr:hypothetical protein [Pyrinomonadaceae bacterium]
LLAPALGLAAAVALHAGWNAAAFFAITYESGAYVVLTYLLVMVPVFVGLLAVVVAALRREGRLLREHLRCDLERGLLAREEYERLCSLRGRASASLGALAGGGGIKAWRARTRLNRAASELAFLRSRVARGLAPAGGPCAEREAEFVRQIQGLQRELAAGGRR